VPGRSSCFAFKGKTEDNIFRKVGEQLHVATVLEGSVRRAGDKLRITAYLINVADGFHLWSQTYDRDHELNIPLPDWLHEDSVRHTHQYIHHGIERPHVVEAYRLASPACSGQAAILDSMLVSLETPLERISELLGRSVESLRQYADLFFNVRDRADDPAYLANIVYPGTRLAGLDASNPLGVRQQLLQAGYEQGAEDVAYLAGLHGNRDDVVVKDAVGGLERQLLTRATMRVRHGQLDRHGERLSRRPSRRMSEGLLRSVTACYANSIGWRRPASEG
jgi:hypothetical protein